MLLGAYGIKDQRKSSTSHERDLDAGSTQARCRLDVKARRLDATEHPASSTPSQKARRWLDVRARRWARRMLDACSIPRCQDSIPRCQGSAGERRKVPTAALSSGGLHRYVCRGCRVCRVCRVMSSNVESVKALFYVESVEYVE